jgi:hypothetical protein
MTFLFSMSSDDAQYIIITSPDAIAERKSVSEIEILIEISIVM